MIETLIVVMILTMMVMGLVMASKMSKKTADIGIKSRKRVSKYKKSKGKK